MHRWIAGITLAAASTAVVWAQTVYVPAAANNSGLSETRWRTDLQVKARGSEGATFTVELLEKESDNSQPISIERTLAAGESLRLANLVETEFGVTGSGALRVTATSGQILVSSRTFNDDPEGTYGQSVPAVPESEATPFGSQVTLIQLSRSADPEAGFRTNIGFVNTTGLEITVQVDLYSADGSPLGTVRSDLLPNDYRQLTDVFAAVTAGDVADGYAVVRTITEGGAFIVYASVVDNRSGDGVLLLGQADEVEPLAQQRLVVFEAFMRPG